MSWEGCRRGGGCVEVLRGQGVTDLHPYSGPGLCGLVYEVRPPSTLQCVGMHSQVPLLDTGTSKCTQT